MIKHVFWNDHRMEPTTVCMRCGMTHDEFLAAKDWYCPKGGGPDGGHE